MPWDPQQYLSFRSERLRPAMDLLARVPLEEAARIVDLGCGTGSSAGLLRQRWPGADILGVDNSREMLREAASSNEGLRCQEADLNHWSPEAPVDLLFSNATLQWLDGHATLFPRLAGFLRPGGCLAVQMPHNQISPSHTAVFEAADAGPWRKRLHPLLRPLPVHDPMAYHRWLSPLATHIDIWETEYLHILDGEDPVTEWTRGSLLVPLLDALEPGEREPFLEAYRARVRTAYPRRQDGRTLFPFKRFFLVAQF